MSATDRNVGLRWYRVELTSSGGVLRVVEQSAAGKNCATVIYIEAGSEDEAGQRALKEYNARLTRERRARLQSEGKCRCGRERDKDDRKYCQICRARHAQYNERKTAGKAEPVGGSGELQKQRSREQRLRTQASRLELLLEVQSAVSGMRTVGEVRAWLSEQIGKETPGKWGGSRKSSGLARTTYKPRFNGISALEDNGRHVYNSVTACDEELSSITNRG